MANFEGPPKKSEQPKTNSIESAFEHRKAFIDVLGRQLEKETKVSLEINGEKLDVDYRMLVVDKPVELVGGRHIEPLENKDGDVVLLIPGFGSGWEGISELGFSLACEGRRVVMPSLPGYGNSSDPSPEYLKNEDFDNEAEVLRQIIDKIDLQPGAKVHLIGHSMGSEIMTSFAKNYPDKVSSLVLLNPAGVNESENVATLFARFLASGAQTNKEFAIRLKDSGEGNYQERLKKYIPKTKSPFALGRLKQRAAEGGKVSKGKLLQKLRETNCPITYISGELETVYPPGEEDDATSQISRIINAVGDETRIERSVMMGLRHNTTIAPDEITAANIDHYLSKVEQARKAKE